MPKIRTTRTKKPPEGFEDIEGILDDYAKKMRDAENESHEGKRKTESLWPIMRISHTRSRYIYELYYKREAISKELYDWLLKEGYADANLIAKWKKSGYEKLCCVRCIQTRSGQLLVDFRRQGSLAWIFKMGVLVREFLDVTRMFKRASAPEQSVLFAGQNPIAYNPNDPLPLWVVQILVIIGMTQLLALILGRIRQPRVIAEVIGGILLGPSVMGRIPGFLTNIFPTTSMPVLVLTSDIGIMLFLFLVGMEIDVRVMRRNARASSIISIVGLVVPLGLGAALAVPIYHTFIDDTVNFGYFILFIAVAVGITAFPVLCRILTELKLVETTVGVTVLAAGVGNDIIGWILLALSVALVNASNGITALYILLSAVAYVLFLTLPVRWAYHWLARRTGCIEKGQPNLMMMTLTIVIVLVSGFFTDIIGIHPIFGGFVAGIIIPHQNGYAIALVEKIEDLVAVLFLPIYFTISGLRTDLGLLNNGITWGYTILICVVSFFSKFIGCSIAAKLTGFTVRESGAVGSLMACKGLVELIALNVGLQAGILNTRVFSMFVLHALVTTFVTTPLVLLFYPERVRVHADALQGGAVGKIEKGASSGPGGPLSDTVKTTFTMVLDRVEQLPAAMTLAQLLQLPSTGVSASIDFKASDPQITPPSPTETAITVDALRLIELTDRASAVLKSHQADMLARSDPVLNVFRTFGQLNHLNVSTSLSVLGQEDYPLRVVQHVRETGSQMVIFPWTSTLPGNGISDERSDGTGSSSSLLGPFDSMKRDWASPAMPTHFMRGHVPRLLTLLWGPR
ncbi:uncharacterized protein FIBRA_03820 [Fibroporia radiculosa]|uniref:Cation/H+ exchanger transmembrane domain-containing protein n=1 Tax=Fibroporia radiculosa TaxID=599839 RepID=J4H2L9_9APHY|nr:uncharacterized protein FIBRA_03820 [Fibroporia radiculosa]CCM01754.1 predicted protein [Fibroporia radiculosa]